MIKIEEKKEKEICFNCKHTKRFHNSIYTEGSCSQPTCHCNCFEESRVFYGMDLFDAYEKGILDTLQALRNKNYDVSYTSEEIIKILTEEKSEKELKK